MITAEVFNTAKTKKDYVELTMSDMFGSDSDDYDGIITMEVFNVNKKTIYDSDDDSDYSGIITMEVFNDVANKRNIIKSQEIIRLNNERHVAEMKKIDVSKLKDKCL